MDIGYVELALDDGTTVYAVWDDSTEDYWYLDEDADDDGTVNAVTTADELHWEWDARGNCWWFYDNSTDSWDWVWEKPELTTTVNCMGLGRRHQHVLGYRLHHSQRCND